MWWYVTVLRVRVVLFGGARFLSRKIAATAKKAHTEIANRENPMCRRKPAVVSSVRFFFWFVVVAVFFLVGLRLVCNTARATTQRSDFPSEKGFWPARGTKPTSRTRLSGLTLVVPKLGGSVRTRFPLIY